jgi:uncharacterized protein (TIGR00369 family)
VTREPPNCELTLAMTCVDSSQPGAGVWSMVPGEHMANPVGVVQGGLLSAFAIAGMSSVVLTNRRGYRDEGTNSELKISFLRAAPVGQKLTCTARVVGGGRRVIFAEAEITDSSGALIAKASSTYLLTPGQVPSAAAEVRPVGEVRPAGGEAQPRPG